MNEWTVTRKWKKDVCIIKKKSYRVYFWGKIYLILCLQLINQFVVVDIYFFLRERFWIWISIVVIERMNSRSFL